MSSNVIPLPSRAAPPERSDEALLAACARGDRAALAQLFQRHQAPVHRFCCRLVGPGAEAEDLVQNTFLTAWSEAAGYRGDAKALAWLFGIAANLARRSFRAERRRRFTLELFGRRDRRTPEALDDEVARRQLLGRLGAALEALPHDLRVAWVLCELEEVPGPEAARALGVKLGTLYRRLHDARKRLLPLLQGGE